MIRETVAEFVDISIDHSYRQFRIGIVSANDAEPHFGVLRGDAGIVLTDSAMAREQILGAFDSIAFDEVGPSQPFGAILHSLDPERAASAGWDIHDPLRSILYIVFSMDDDASPIGIPEFLSESDRLTARSPNDLWPRTGLHVVTGARAPFCTGASSSAPRFEEAAASTQRLFRIEALCGWKPDLASYLYQADVDSQTVFCFEQSADTEAAISLELDGVAVPTEDYHLQTNGQCIELHPMYRRAFPFDVEMRGFAEPICR